MARYLETAARYEDIPKELLRMIADENKPKAAELIARLVNAGVVCNPRPANGTVRLNIVKAVTKHLPIVCSLQEVEIGDTGRTYKSLVVNPK